MVDTSRTRAQIGTLLSDNNSGEISPQDLRDAIESIVNPVAAGGFDLFGNAHRTFGDGTIDGDGLTGYTPSTVGVLVSESVNGTAASYDLQAGLSSRLTYDRSTAFPGGDYSPSIYALVGETIWDARTGVDGVNNNDAVGLVAGARLLSTATIPPYVMYGGEVGIVVEADAPQVTTELAGVQATVGVLGSSPSVPWSTVASGLATKVITQRTGVYSVAGAHLKAKAGAGVPDTLYGLLVDEQTGATTAWNIYSAGVTSKNKFEGKVIIGEHSAFGPDAQIDHGPVSGGLVYPTASVVLDVRESWDVETLVDGSDGNSLLNAIYGTSEYNRAVPFSPGKQPPSNVGGIFKAVHDASASATGQASSAAILAGSYSFTQLKGTLPPADQVIGAAGAVSVADGAAKALYGMHGLSSSVGLLGASPTDPGDVSLVYAEVYTERTGAYRVDSFRAIGAWGSGIPDELYGVYIEPHTKGAVQSWNIYSAGVTSKNKFEGALQFSEAAQQAAPAANHVSLQAIDNGAGKTQLVAQFATGAVQVLATEL